MRREIKTTFTLEEKEIKEIIAKHLNSELPNLIDMVKGDDILLLSNNKGSIQAIFTHHNEKEV